MPLFPDEIHPVAVFVGLTRATNPCRQPEDDGMAVSVFANFQAIDISGYGELLHPTDLAFHAFFGTIFLIGALTRRESCHKGLVVLGMASFILYIVIVFARLH